MSKPKGKLTIKCNGVEQILYCVPPKDPWQEFYERNKDELDNKLHQFPPLSPCKVNEETICDIREAFIKHVQPEIGENGNLILNGDDGPMILNFSKIEDGDIEKS